MTQFADFQRGLLPMLLLAELHHEPGHGYSLSLRLAERGFDRVKGAHLYPVLARLESDGYCTPVWTEGDGGPGRKVYHLTTSGEERLAELRHSWKLLVPLTNKLIADDR
ncbi:PadR family transcriptional regulator [Arcanobacterium phocae]|uniref:Transcriptional regulator, PadR family n=1 Tax=Arcanobacterium phocae TaxID=131112 RepID=A0A1H2LI24_9ACTO|nr:PadR family transcriptional regulator [Arcanobacterium phocae]SDU80395.1 transcriptional regulator, PadR family [Arcanobacterium phocae]